MALSDNIEDALIEKPQGFHVGKKQFYLYPASLGKALLLKRHIENLALSEENIKVNPYLEFLRVVTAKKDDCCRIIAYHTCRTKSEVFDNESVEKKVRFFRENCNDSELVTLLMMLMDTDKSGAFIKNLGIDKELRQYSRAMGAKDTKGSYNFCGMSEYGNLIDWACERYGWSYQYVVWGISLTNIKMLMADHIKNIYLSDDERKRVHIPRDRKNVVNGDNKEELEKAIKSQSWK